MTKKYQWIVAMLVAILFLGLITNTIFPNKAPNLKVSSTKGETLMIYDKNYKFTIINFWATDCPGCIKEMPRLVDTYSKYKKQGIQIIAVSMFYDPPSQVLNFIKKNDIPFPVVIDADNKIAKQGLSNNMDKAIGRKIMRGEPADSIKKWANEEVEQIDELKKSTLGSYIKKASESRKKALHGSKPDLKTWGKRQKGITKAIHKLTKEETMENEHIKEAINNILDENLVDMKENFIVALQEKAMEKLEERKKEIAAQYFAQD